MVFLQYTQKYLGPFGNKIKCEYCGATMKGQMAEMLEHLHYTGGQYSPMYFCFGHLEKWAKQQRREFALKKL